MDANEHESGNGAAVHADGSVAAAIVIERNSKFSGQLKFAGAITIEGQVEGELIADRIVVHEGGVVNASDRRQHRHHRRNGQGRCQSAAASWKSSPAGWSMALLPPPQ